MKTLNFTKSDGLIFGIYPGGWLPSIPAYGVEATNSPNDIPKRAHEALAEISTNKPFLIRGYTQYLGQSQEGFLTPQNVEQYCQENIRLDFVINFRPKIYDKNDWIHFIQGIIQRYKEVLTKIQITEEPNNPDTASGGDGSSPNVEEAIFDGVIAAKEEIKRLNLDVLVGFNAVISFNPDDTFWPKMAELQTEKFQESLDYVGLDFYPGVFRPLPPNFSMTDAVMAVLQQFRKNNLTLGAIPQSVPIHITENGFPTSETRTEDEQAENIKIMIETVHAQRHSLNITHYAFFSLRDSISTAKGFQFGLIRDDYTPKKGFFIFKNLVQTLS